MRFKARLLPVLLVSGTALLGQGSKPTNLETCLSGKYPALCDHASLTPDQQKRVAAAEKRENLNVCMIGRYPALCRHDLLEPEELKQVKAAEHAENLKVCADGRYPALCRHDLLTPEQAQIVAAAEAKAAANRPRVPVTHNNAQSGDCESGHSIASVEGDGRIIKLEDGSLWEVNEIDTVTTAIWLPVSDVIVCGQKMINVDDNESVQVTRILTRGSKGSIAPKSSRPTYTVQASADDETFVINGNVFKAHTYCFNVAKGDKVIFVDGSASGACASAKILNLRTDEVCEVWCE
jgi:hypothetical protein